MVTPAIENNVVVDVKKTERQPRDTVFFGELRKLRDALMSSDVNTLDDVYEKSIEVESGMDNISDKDYGLMTLSSDIFGVVKYLGREDVERSKYKKESIEIQQTVVREVLGRFHEGKFEDEKAPAFFYTMSEVFSKLKQEGFIAEKYSMFAGIRGMVSAALLFAKAGFEVDPAPYDWDAYHDIDLIVKKNGLSFSLSVKSVMGTRDRLTGKEFSFEQRPVPRDMSEDYDEMSKHLWINIPNMNTADGEDYCTSSANGLAIGLPNDFQTAYFVKKCNDMKLFG